MSVDPRSKFIQVRVTEQEFNRITQACDHGLGADKGTLSKWMRQTLLTAADALLAGPSYAEQVRAQYDARMLTAIPARPALPAILQSGESPTNTPALLPPLPQVTTAPAPLLLSLDVPPPRPSVSSETSAHLDAIFSRPAPQPTNAERAAVNLAAAGGLSEKFLHQHEREMQKQEEQHRRASQGVPSFYSKASSVLAPMDDDTFEQ